MAKQIVILTPQQQLSLFRARKKRREIDRFKRKCAAAIDKFYGKPIEISTLEFTSEVVDEVKKTLENKQWLVTSLSEFDGHNPRIKLEMK